MEEKVQGYVTKYALTQGVYVTEVAISEGGYGYERRGGFASYGNGLGREGQGWARTLDEALRIADEMRKKKVQSLRKQIKKLEGLDFALDFEMRQTKAGA